MGNCIEIVNFCKSYKSFSLENVNITVPTGSVMGFVGENGAGKTTTIKALLGLTSVDSGSVKVLGVESSKLTSDVKEKIGVVFDTICFPPSLNAKQLDKVFAGMYKNWDSKKYFELLEKFEIPLNKKIKGFSRGMGMRLSLAQALSHNAELLILDEPTGGLDPIIRNETINILRDYMEDENHSIFISTHITSDLDRLADYICFIHKGRIVFTEERDVLFDSYRILKCTDEQLANIDKEDIIGMRKGRFSSEVLTKNAEKYSNIASDVPNIDELMVYFVSGEGN